ncbi:MAG TPA: hypothetical protein VFL91_12365 [Thermomicrobiales bacterium]|nr:hypothetical protein [Thermomicrobiales bacterium]
MPRATRRPAALLAALLLAGCSWGATPTPRTIVPPTQPAGTVPVIVATPPPEAAAAAPGQAAPAGPPGQATAASAAPGGTTAPATSPTPAGPAPRLVKLTWDGCCPQPQWLADGRGVFFYGPGKPGGAQNGTWWVPRDGGAPQLLNAHYGAFTPDQRLVAYPDGGLTRLARVDGTPLGAVDSQGLRVYFAPTGDRIAWLVLADDVDQGPVELEAPTRVAVAGADGTGARVLPVVLRTETLQWFPDGRRLLINARDAAGAHPGLVILDIDTGALTRLVDAGSLESPAISPDGRAIAYTATLQADPAQDGVWLVNADGSGRRRLPIAGGYRWAPDGRSLLYVPAPSDLPTDELWRYRLADGAAVPVVRADRARFAIVQDEWEVAPDGAAIAFRSAYDGAIWTLQFAP